MFKVGDRVSIKVPAKSNFNVGTVAEVVHDDPEFDYEVDLDGYAESPYGDLLKLLGLSNLVPFSHDQLEPL